MAWKGSIILILVLTLGCIEVPEIKDCGSDPNCFLDAEKNCTPAKMSLTAYMVEYYGEVKGREANVCKIYWSMSHRMGEKMDMICKFPMDLMEKPSGFGPIPLPSSDIERYCEGRMVELIKGVPKPYD
jgi:hypothetical protein